MKYIFIENSLDFTSNSLNLKAIDSAQKNLINFVKELKKKGHHITIYNNTKKNVNEEGIFWKKLTCLAEDKLDADILIVCNEQNYIDVKVKASVKLYWLTSEIQEDDKNSILIGLIKNKFIIMHSSYSLISHLPNAYNYIPKFFFDVGVSDIYFQNTKYDVTSSKALVTSHPLRGLDWLIEIWVNIISLKLPWAEMHVYSQTLSKNKFIKNVKINNLKLKLIKYKNNGIHVLKPLAEPKFIENLINYKVHLNPSNAINSSLSILESQAAGIPVVSINNTEIQNYIYHNETGFITDDANIFSKKVIDILSDNATFLRFRSNSKLNNRIKSWKDVIENFETKINENFINR